MNEQVMINSMYSIMYYSAVLAGPPLIVGTVVAFIIGLFQAVTQIQEQTLPQTVKMIAIGAVLLMFGGLLSAPLYNLSDQLFSNFHTYEQS